MIILHKLFILFLILLTFPLMIIIGLLIYLTSGHPILFFQKRIGKNGKEFTIIKFRTMIPNAHTLQQSLKKHNEADGPVFKIHNDPRLTKFGAFLYHTGLDELPQLFNVLLGTMSLIGPRPLPIEEAKKLKPWQKQRERILPGIISPWILNGYHTRSFHEWMKSDIEYAKNKSFLFDISITIKFLRYWILLIAREIQRRI